MEILDYRLMILVLSTKKGWYVVHTLAKEIKPFFLITCVYFLTWTPCSLVGFANLLRIRVHNAYQKLTS